jgi:hypothetical protein
MGTVSLIVLLVDLWRGRSPKRKKTKAKAANA